MAKTVTGVLSDTATVEIEQDAPVPEPAPTGPVPTAVELSPASVSLAANATQQFTARARLSDGTTGAVVVRFTPPAAR